MGLGGASEAEGGLAIAQHLADGNIWVTPLPLSLAPSLGEGAGLDSVTFAITVAEDGEDRSPWLALANAAKRSRFSCCVGRDVVLQCSHHTMSSV